MQLYFLVEKEKISVKNDLDSFKTNIQLPPFFFTLFSHSQIHYISYTHLQEFI
jgi:hypothetical protein